MLRSLCVSFLCLVLGACATVSHKVTIAEPPGTDTEFVLDLTKPDSYPSFGLGQGNIYSCRYGIRMLLSNEFDPPKAKMFADLISSALPKIKGQQVKLQRFDVYINHRLKSLNGAGNVIGGALGAIISEAGRVNENVYTFQKLLVDTDPYTARNPNEHQVGCDDAHEGEFYASEISGGHTVVVIWLKFSIDDRAYNFRTFYQYQPANISEEDAGVSAAIQMTFPAVAERISKS